MTGCGPVGANQLGLLPEKSKQRAWDVALSQTRNDHLLEEIIQVTQAGLLSADRPNTAA